MPVSSIPARLITAAGAPPSYSARAWVIFDGTGTPSIRAAANVSSITDNSTGDYTVNFQTAMPSAEYCVTGISGTPGVRRNFLSLSQGGAPTTTGVRVDSLDYQNNWIDATHNSVAVFL